MGKRSFTIILIILTLLLLIAGFVSILVSINKITKQDELFFQEISKISNTQEILINNFKILNSDSLQTRTILGLPPINYNLPGSLDGEINGDKEEGEDLNIEYYSGLDYLLSIEKELSLKQSLNSYFEKPEIKNELDSLKLSLDNSSHPWLIKRADLSIYSVIISSAGARIKPLYGDKEIEIPAEPEKLLNYFDETLPEILSYNKRISDETSKYLAFLNSRELLDLTRNKKLILQRQSPDSFWYEIQDPNDTVFQIDFNNLRLDYRIDSEEFENFETFREALINKLNAYDSRPREVILLNQRTEEISGLITDPAFMDLLKREGITLNPVFREDNDYRYFDISRLKGERIGSYAIQKHQGIVYLMDKDDVPIKSLRTLTDSIPAVNPKKKIILPNLEEFTGPVTLPKGSETILLCGLHETDTDTIMLVHCDSINNKVTIISLPRDIFYHGRKINTLYSRLGARGFVSEISKITGLNISKYIIIDMYAFIDVIDIIGGVEVTLEEDLIDPSYKVKQNGVWSTLYYKKGTYKLSGLEALRLARSRNFSSDFERAHRQHSILLSLKDTVLSLGIKDIGRFYQLLGIVIKYVETDMSVTDLAGRILLYKDAVFSGNNVIDTSNILYSTYSNLYFLPEEEQNMAKEQEDFNKGAWILLPRDDNFDFIPAYIKSLIEGTPFE